MARIEELKKLPKGGRQASLEKMFQKNRSFFLKNYPAVGKALRPGACAPFHIVVTDDFLEIVNKETGELCHPEAGLDKFAMALGDWTHNAWNDLIEGGIYKHADHGPYSQFLSRFQGQLLSCFPGLHERMKQRVINLPQLTSGKRFSNSVIFAGIFHGLHIDYYLSRTQLNNVAFVEPDISRFVLSCYFLDYAALDKRFNGLILHVGGGFPHKHLDRFLSNAKQTAPVWVRVLPGYASDQVEPMLRQFRLKLRHLYDVWVPAEHQLQALQNTQENIVAAKKIFSATPKLSAHARIAVVGSGPSLSQDIPNLLRLQDQLIIFAAYSSVSALLKAGIKPDFQFNIEVREWDEGFIEQLSLDRKIPVVTMIGDCPEKFSGFESVYMLPERGGIHPVKFKETIPFLSPTTGNTALGFACYSQPEEIYLFGLDFGFRQSNKTHVSGSSVYQNDAEHERSRGSNNVEVPTNFQNVDAVYSQPYFNLARLCAEYAISANHKKSRIFNCSDGALINGALCFRSQDIETKSYRKDEDIKAIKDAFSVLNEGENYDSFTLNASALLEEYKKAMKRHLAMSRFGWLKFVKKIDEFRASVEGLLPRKIAREGDSRINPYLVVVEELLVAWYRLLCFTNNEEEWTLVYEKGYEVLSALIDEMVWNVEDNIAQKF